jgi:hypothetical protein
MQAQIKMLKDKYDEITVEYGDEIGLIGMQVMVDRQLNKVILTQPKQVARIIETFQVTKVHLTLLWPNSWVMMMIPNCSTINRTKCPNVRCSCSSLNEHIRKYDQQQSSYQQNITKQLD